MTHAEIFDDPSHLPTFSSPAIEAHLHKIPNLSRYFLYFNDDVFLGAPVHVEDFLLPSSGAQRIYLSWELPDCAPQCSESFIGDHYCDVSCNVSACEFDGGDCKPRSKSPTSSLLWKSPQQSPPPGKATDYDEEDYGVQPLTFTERVEAGEDFDKCGLGCAVSWIGDGICDSSCRNAACGYDAGDCPKDSKHLLPLFGLKQTASIPRKDFFSNTSRPIGASNWFAFLIDVSEAYNHGRIVDLTHNRPAFVRSLVYVKKWSAILAVLSLKAMDRFTQNDTVLVGCNVKYDEYLDPDAKNATGGRIHRQVKSRNGRLTFSVSRNGLSPLPVNISTPLPSSAQQHHAPKKSQRETDDLDDDEQDDDEDEYLEVDDEHEKLPSAASAFATAKARFAYQGKSRKNRTSAVIADDDDEEDSYQDMLIKDRPWIDHDENDDDDEDAGERKKRSVDTFGRSLVHTKALLNKHFQRKIQLNRKVPAHMPHFIDRFVMEKLAGVLKDAFKTTSSHRFRSEDDVQYGYAYFTYLMARDEDVAEGELETLVWSFIDTDKDGCADANELRTLTAMLLSEDAYFVKKTKTPTMSSVRKTSSYSFDDDLDDFDKVVLSSAYAVPKINSKVLISVYEQIWADAKAASFMPVIDSCLSLHVLKRATRAMRALVLNVRRTMRRTRPKFEIVDSVPHVTFAMLKDNPVSVLKTLDGIRARSTKFVCINDDTTPEQSEKSAKLVDKALRHFLEYMFPERSKYELGEQAIAEKMGKGLGNVAVVAATKTLSPGFPSRTMVWIVVLVIGVGILLFARYERGRFIKKDHGL